MLKRVKTSLSNTQNWNVKDAAFYIFGKIFLNIFSPKNKDPPERGRLCFKEIYY